MFEAPPQGVLGQALTLAGEVRTGGPTTHHGVVATIDVPEQLAVQSASYGAIHAPCSVTGGTVTCEVGTIGGHSAVPVEVVVNPLGTGPASVTVSVTSATPQDQPDPEPDTQVLEFPVLGVFVDMGFTHSLQYDPLTLDVPSWLRVDVRNHGTQTATGVRLEVSTPPGVTVTSVSTAPVAGEPEWDACTATVQTAVCDADTFPPGQVLKVFVFLANDELVSGDIDIAVTADQPEPNPDEHPNDRAIPVTVAGPNADLTATFENVPATVVVGELAPLSLRVENNGASPVEAATVTVEVPAGWTVESGCSGSCALGSILADSGETLTIWVRPTEPQTGAVFRATVGSELPDLGQAPNDATAVIDALAAEVDLGLSSQSPSSLPGADPEQYQLRVTNYGPAAATGIVVEGTFPDSVTLQSTDGNFNCTIDGQSFSCERPLALAAGQSDDLFILLVHNDLFSPVTYSFSVTSSLPEVPNEVGANTLEVTRDPPGRISGVVTRPDGSPASGVGVGAHINGELWSSVFTGADGSYVIFLPTGEWTLLFLPRPGSGLAPEWFDNKPSEDQADPLVITAPGEQVTADVQLQPADLPEGISGVVTLPDGSPASGVTVRAYKNGDGIVPSGVPS